MCIHYHETSTPSYCQSIVFPKTETLQREPKDSLCKVCPSVEVPSVQSHRFRRLLTRRAAPELVLYDQFSWRISTHKFFLCFTVRNAAESIRIRPIESGWLWRSVANTRPRQQSKLMSLERISASDRTWPSCLDLLHRDIQKALNLSVAKSWVKVNPKHCLRHCLWLPATQRYKWSWILLALLWRWFHMKFLQVEKKELNFYTLQNVCKMTTLTMQVDLSPLNTTTHSLHTLYTLSRHFFLFHHHHGTVETYPAVATWTLTKRTTFELRPHTTKSTASRPICEVK